MTQMSLRLKSKMAAGKKKKKTAAGLRSFLEALTGESSSCLHFLVQGPFINLESKQRWAKSPCATTVLVFCLPLP